MVTTVCRPQGTHPAVDSAPAKEYWMRKLCYPIVPLSGPLRPNRTLGEARATLVERLPTHCRTLPCWERAMALLIVAGRSGRKDDIRAASEQMLRALDQQGWLK
jgi:hypothetical protein